MKLKLFNPLVTLLIALSFFVALLVALMMILPGSAFAGTPIDKTVAAQPNGDVQISNLSGSVDITAWSRNEIHVGGTLGTGNLRLALEKTATGVTIRVVLPQEGNRNAEGSRLVVQLPAGSQLSTNTVSADISAAGLTGPTRLEAVSGNVTLNSKSADISAKSVSGDVGITGSAPDARISAQSISGEVTLVDINGELQAGSVSGDIHLNGENRLTRAKLGTTSGDIGFAATLAANGDYEFNSVSGDITLDLPKIPAARFDVSSFSGDIDTNFGPRPQPTSEYGPGKEWHFQNGQGGAHISINTMSGDIHIRAPHP